MGSAPDQLSSTLEAVVARFADVVRHVSWRHRLSDADVDEVMQEVRIRLWRAYGDADGARVGETGAAYVYRTAMSAALDLLRRRRARREDRTVAFDERAPVPTTDGTERRAEAAELAAQVARAIDAIPASRRPVVRMHLTGYSREEIAALMGWSEAKTRNLLYRGLGDLRERLTESGITWEGGT
jgi:RNA polymerase sigma factor (sigma-70 family)